MASMSDSDEDDISSTIKRKQKLTRNKIDDSDSSSDEENGEKDTLSTSTLNQSITAVNEESCSSRLVIDENSKGPLSGTCSNTKSDDEVSVKDDMTIESQKTINDNSGNEDNEKSENSDNEDNHDNEHKKDKKGKLKKHCFNDESSDEENNDNVRKTYESRTKSKSNSNITGNDDEEIDSEAQEKFDNALKNKDLFDAESEDEGPKTVNENEDENEDEDEQMEQSNDEEEELIPKKSGVKRPGKDFVKESKSEQQRLLREQKFNLPYHIPEVKPLKDFLSRVPELKTKKKSKTKAEEVIELDVEPNNENGDSKSGKKQLSIDSLFQQKPKLSLSKDDSIVFEGCIEFDVLEEPKKQDKKKGAMDSFMQRFEKQTRGKKKPVNDVNTNSIVVVPEKEKTPGGRRVAFAEQMKLKIRKERTESLKELEKERKLFNEENSSEEEAEFEDDETDDEEEENTEDTKGTKQTEDDGESSNDEELEKWNMEDRRKAIEIEMEEEEQKNKKSSTEEKDTNSVDFSVEGRKTPQPDQLEKDDLHWEDSSSTVSSFLPAGQGDPTGRKNSAEESSRMTPFSKMMKSGLLDSTSNLCSNNSNSQQAVGITLPCEDTQDLYKQTYEKKDDEESQMVVNDFELTLEETQYTQVIDSQGFLSDSKKSKRQLFDVDVKEGANDFSQVIGLCSGKFDDDDDVTDAKKKDGGTSNGGALDGLFKKDDEFSMTQVIGLCSGKFTDDNDISATAAKDAVDTAGDESNPPIEHPFSSRLSGERKKSDGDASGLFETQDNIFEDKKPKSADKPSGLDNIMNNDNFMNDNDNAMDFCTAPFSGQASEDDTNASGESSEGIPSSQNTFDTVGKWLKKDKNSENVSDDDDDGSGSEIGEKRKKVKKVKKGKSNEEDDVFADNEDAGSEGDDEEEEDEEEENEGDEDDGVVSSEEEDGEGEEEEVADELLEYQDAITKGSKKKWSKNAFAEKEAELSGSDINSDAEELGSEYDEYEVDSDVEVLPSGEKLKSQVHKIHQKKVLDQDQREVRLLQELYIEDADRAYGKKRQRNFRWRNVNDDDGVVQPGDSDEEAAELNLDDNISQKLERAEREKYISELQEKEKVTLDKSSQSMLEMIKNPTQAITDKPLSAVKPRLSSKSDGRSSSQKRSGSFMSSNKSSFSHLASMKVGGQSAKSFVFQAKAGEEEKKSADKENRATTRKTPMSEPAKKRTKVQVESSDSQSIFDLL